MSNHAKKDPKQLLIIGAFVVMLLMLPLLVVAVKVASDIRSHANPQAQPTEVIFSNITSNSFTVSYITAQPVQGYVNALGNGQTTTAPDYRDSTTKGTYLTHYMTVNNLQPLSMYTVTIISGESNFTDATWTVTTSAIGNIQPPHSILGKVQATGDTKGALVYAAIGDPTSSSNIISQIITNSNSTFTIDENPLTDASGNLINTDGKSLIVYVDDPGVGQGEVQTSAKTITAIPVPLSTTPITFNPASPFVTSTVTPNPVPVIPVSYPVSYPLPVTGNNYILDDFSEQLLVTPYSSGAEKTNPDVPYNIFISNVSPTGFSVNWLTKEATSGYIVILDAQVPTKVADNRDGSITTLKKRYTHSVDVQSGSIPAGTTLSFNIVVNNITYGSNIQDVATDFSNQFSLFAQNNYDPSKLNNQLATLLAKNKPSTAKGAKTSTTKTTTLILPTAGATFIYVLNPAISLKPFKTIIPGAPNSPPLPQAQQGTIKSLITTQQYTTALAQITVSNPDVSLSSIDINRDTLVAARNSNGIWVSTVVTDTGGFSLSLGSSLTTQKDKYITLKEGDAITVNGYGDFNQIVSSNPTYSQTPLTLILTNPLSLISILGYSIINNPLIYGYTSANSIITFNINGETESISSAADGSWQSLTKNLKLGINHITITNSITNSTLGYDFIVSLPELPVTGISSDTIYLIIGLTLLLTGSILYIKFKRKPLKL